MAIRTGSLRHRITIERVTETIDAYGGRVPTWEAVGQRWAQVQDVRASETEAIEGATRAERRVTVRMHGGPGAPGQGDRIIDHRCRTLWIDGVVEYDEGREVVCECIQREGDNA